MNMYIAPEYLVGNTFTVPTNQFDPEQKYVCIGYGSNDTFLVFGGPINKQKDYNKFSTIRSFKLSEVQFE